MWIDAVYDILHHSTSSTMILFLTYFCLRQPFLLGKDEDDTAHFVGGLVWERKHRLAHYLA
jgi:hypothetical protein